MREGSTQAFAAQLLGKVAQFVIEGGFAAVVQKAGAQRDERKNVGDEQNPRRVHAEGRQNEHGAGEGEQKAARPMTLSRT